MFGINKLKEENRILREKNIFLQGNVNFFYSEYKRTEKQLREEISKLEGIIKKKDEELSIQYDLRKLREKNSDTEKYY